MGVPEGVERVRARGRTYYYWNPGRGTKRESGRIRLPDAEQHPAAFFREVERLRNRNVAFPTGSVGELVDRYRESEDYKALADSTRSSYDVHLNRFRAPAAWGLFRVRDLGAPGVLAARDAMKDTPTMANQMLAVGRTLWDWAIPLGLAELNPFDKVKNLAVADCGHVPWPSWAIDYVIEHAWEDLRRLVVLGRMTCQRESDLIRMGPIHRGDRPGVWCRPKKTQGRRRSFFIPISTSDAIEIDRWAKTPITFSNSRWKEPIDRHRDDLYLYSPRGEPYNTSSLRARWGRWLTRTDAGKIIVKRWKAWIEECIQKYDWEIDAEEARGPTIHGLRGTGILVRHAEGFDVDQISNDIGMSRQMVDHYMRFKDQMEMAAAGRRRLRLIAGGEPGEMK